MAPNVGPRGVEKRNKNLYEIKIGLAMNPLDLFDSRIPLRRIYLQSPTSRKNVPKGMKDLDKYLSDKKGEKDNKVKIN